MTISSGKLKTNFSGAPLGIPQTPGYKRICDGPQRKILNKDGLLCMQENGLVSQRRKCRVDNSIRDTPGEFVAFGRLQRNLNKDDIRYAVP